MQSVFFSGSAAVSGLLLQAGLMLVATWSIFIGLHVL